MATTTAREEYDEEAQPAMNVMEEETVYGKGLPDLKENNVAFELTSPRRSTSRDWTPEGRLFSNP